MPQSVGSNPITGYGQFNTLIPLLSETADITEALRLYHFGATTSTYDIANTDPAQLPNPGIAYTLYDLQDQINTISGSLGIAYSEFTAKGDILTATGPGTAASVQPLPLGSQGQVLTVNTATATGLQWSTPYAAPTIGSTSIPSGATVTTIAGLTLTNPTVNAGSGVIVLPGSNTPAQTADGSIVWDLDSDLLTVGTGSGRKTMVDTDSTQTLSNKTLSNPTITNNLYLAVNNTIVFEGSSDDTFETTLTVTNPTADRTITLPNVTGTVVTTGDTGTVTSTMILDGTIVNADISASAAIAYSKLSLTGSIVNADISASAAIAYSKLSLTGSIVNADISASAAIAISKLAASTISGVSLGNNLNALTISTGLTGTSYNGSSAVTIAVDTNTIATKTYVNSTVEELKILTLMGAVL